MPPELSEEQWKAIAESMRWAHMAVKLEEIALDNGSLVRELARYKKADTVAILSGLLTLPEYQTSCIRIETLISLAIGYCDGKRSPNIKEVTRWFRTIGRSKIARAENPAEDVFVSVVRTSNGCFRILEGAWEASAFYTQILADLAESLPDEHPFAIIKSKFFGLLQLSEIICRKSQLDRYQIGEEKKHSVLRPVNVPGKANLISRTTITYEVLLENGLDPELLNQFIFDESYCTRIRQQEIGNSDLEFTPLLSKTPTELVVALPTALSIAAREFLINALNPGEATDVFDSVLADHYAKQVLNTRLLGWHFGCRLHWEKTDSGRFSTARIEVDKGYYIGLVFFLPSIRTHRYGHFKEPFVADNAFVKELQTAIDQIQTLENNMIPTRSGIMHLVGCGWGKGFYMDTPDLKLEDPWSFEFISAADLTTLSSSNDIAPATLFRIRSALTKAEEVGLKLSYENGLLNLISWIGTNDGHLIPHEMFTDNVKPVSKSTPFHLTFPTNLLRGLRIEVHSAHDLHCAIDNLGIWHRIQRILPFPVFDSGYSKYVYGSTDNAHRGRYTSLFKNDISIWQTIETPNLDSQSVERQLTEMAELWIGRIGRALEEKCLTGKDKLSLKLQYVFEDSGPTDTIQIEGDAAELERMVQLEEVREPNAIRIRFKSGYLALFQTSDNVAERVFVRSAINGIFKLLQDSNIPSSYALTEEDVVKNNDARNLHMFSARSFKEYAQEWLPRKVLRPRKLDDGEAKLGLAQKYYPKDTSGTIEGIRNCTELLAKVVEGLLDDIVVQLSKTDRIELLMRLVTNCETSYAKENSWNRTSAAIIGLYGSDQNTLKQYATTQSKYAGASLTSRTLAEIGLCECSLEAEGQMADIEIESLLAKMRLAIGYGELSDAIYYNAVAPKLTISVFGDILFEYEFATTVVEPVINAMHSERINWHAEKYTKLYEKKNVQLSIKEHFDGEFWNAWIEEMGFDIDVGRFIIEALENMAITQKVPVLLLRREDCLSAVCGDRVSREDAISFLSRFSLPPRNNWSSPPSGFSVDDLKPWKFGRRLSLVARPILAIEEGDNPRLIIPPGSLRNGYFYVISGAYHGTLKSNFFLTDKMRNKWLGKARDGDAFETEVSDSLIEARWNARVGLGIPEILNTKTDIDYGDIDVLAWDLEKKLILVIECKDISSARNYSEMARLLSDFQGKTRGGKRDKLKRHLDRVSLLKTNAASLLEFVGLKEGIIKPCLVSSGVLPVQFSKIDQIKGLFVGQIDDLIEEMSHFKCSIW